MSASTCRHHHVGIIIVVIIIMPASCRHHPTPPPHPNSKSSSESEVLNPVGQASKKHVESMLNRHIKHNCKERVPPFKVLVEIQQSMWCQLSVQSTSASSHMPAQEESVFSSSCPLWHTCHSELLRCSKLCTVMRYDLLQPGGTVSARDDGNRLSWVGEFSILLFQFWNQKGWQKGCMQLNGSGSSTTPSTLKTS